MSATTTSPTQVPRVSRIAVWLIAEVDAKLAAAEQANPEFQGKTVAVGAWYTDQYGAYVRGDSRADLMESVGFKVKPQIQELATGSFYIELSREQVELLDADLTVVFPIGADADVIKKDRVLNQIPAAKAGRMVVLEDKNLYLAFSSGSTLGTLYAVDNAVPLFAKALGGSGSS